MPNNINNDLPSLTPDRDQVEAYQSTRTHQDTRNSKVPGKTVHSQPTQKKSVSAGSIILNFLVISAIGFAGWWFYQQDQISQAMIKSSEERIHELERQLSVTGEEMGESTVAMRVKLDKLGKKTEELWVQMDKLWASAWRRNQQDITSLKQQLKTANDNVSSLSNQINANEKQLKAVNQKQTEADFNIGILNEQLQTAENLKAQLNKLKDNFSTLESKALNQDKQQISLAGQISQLSKTQNMLVERLKQLETQLNKPSQ